MFTGNTLELDLISVLVQSSTTVPIPTILDWSDDSSNAIGSEYIIMEHAIGVQLHQRWPTMSGEQRISCIHAISTNVQQITAIKFPAYGSLYFDNRSIESASKVPLAQGFCIGPHCGTRYWECNIVKRDTTLRYSLTGDRVSSVSIEPH